MLCICSLRSDHMCCYLGVGHILHWSGCIADSSCDVEQCLYLFIFEIKYYYCQVEGMMHMWICNVIRPNTEKLTRRSVDFVPSVSSTWGRRGGLQMEQTPGQVQVAVQWRHSPPSGPHDSTPLRTPSSSQQSPHGSSSPHARLHLLFKSEYKRCTAWY